MVSAAKFSGITNEERSIWKKRTWYILMFTIRIRLDSWEIPSKPSVTSVGWYIHCFCSPCYITLLCRSKVWSLTAIGRVWQDAVIEPEEFNKSFVWEKPSRCVLTNLYNVLYTVSTQQYMNTVIKYMQSGHIRLKKI